MAQPCLSGPAPLCSSSSRGDSAQPLGPPQTRLPSPLAALATKRCPLAKGEPPGFLKPLMLTPHRLRS